MKSHSTLIHNLVKESFGFTLVEILVVMGIMVLLASLGLFYSMDAYRGNSLHAEKDMVISILQKARSRAMNNIDQSAHGVRFEAGKYILFEGNDWDSATNKEEVQVGGNSQVAGLPKTVVFGQLNADSTDQTLTISDGTKNFNIEINSAGRISWQ